MFDIQLGAFSIAGPAPLAVQASRVPSAAAANRIGASSSGTISDSEASAAGTISR